MKYIILKISIMMLPMTNIDDYIYKAGEIYWKLYNELGYSQYLKSAKKSYEKISSRDERAKRRLGEIFLVEKSM